MNDIGKLIKTIETENEWRISEIINIKKIYLKLIDREEQNKYILKSSIPIIYAHWEGYVVSSLKIVFQALNEFKISYKKMHNRLLTCAYEQHLKDLDRSTQFQKYEKHLCLITSTFDQHVQFSTSINTNSNLNFKVLQNICYRLRLDLKKFEQYKLELNQLVNIRNAIAHGENCYTFSTLQDIEKYFTLYYNISYDFLIEIENFFQNKSYLQ